MRSVIVLGVLAACSVEESPYGQTKIAEAKIEPAPAKVEPAPAKVEPAPAKVEPAPAMPEGDAPQAVRVDPKPDAVTIVDAGAEPRKPLRLTPRVGDEQKVTLRMQMTIGMKLGTREVPPTPMPDVTVVLATKVTSTGDAIRYDFTVEQARRSEGEFSERVLVAVDQAVTAMQQTKGTFAVDARGLVRETKIDSPELPTPGLRPSLTGFQQSFGQLYPALPEEPIGVGAKWNAISHFDLGGAAIQQEATYTLLRREGEEVDLAVTFSQAATSVDKNVTSFGGRGEGTVTLQLAKVAPIKGSATSRSLTIQSIQVTDRQDVTMDMTLALAIEGGN